MSVIAKHSMFDGLFSVALKPTGAFRDELKARGFDADQPKTEYPIVVWHDCLDIAAKYLYPNESRERAWWLLGERFIEGYLETLVGKIIAVALPFLSAKTFVQRSPRFMSTGMVGADVVLEWTGERSVVVKLANVAFPSGHLLGGTVAVCLKRIGAKGVKLEGAALGAGGSQISIAWD